MSYSIDVPAGPKHDLGDRLNASLEVARRAAQADAALTPVLEDQYAAVVNAAHTLAAQVGRPEDHVEVRIAGHANVAHTPSDGYGDEGLVVSVHVVRAANA